MFNIKLVKMKKILIFIMLLAPMSMLAQKFGYVNSADIVQIMPEYAQAQKKIQDLEKTYTDDFNAMRTELEKKGSEFEKLQQDSVPENILKRRYEEIMQLQQRLEQYRQEVAANLAKAENDEMMNIQTKLRCPFCSAPDCADSTKSPHVGNIKF